MITPNFDRESRHDPRCAFTQVLYGASFLTETDLNEMQQIERERLQNVVQLLTKNKSGLLSVRLDMYEMPSTGTYICHLNEIYICHKGEISYIERYTFDGANPNHSPGYVQVEVGEQVVTHTDIIKQNGFAQGNVTLNNPIPDPLFPDVEVSRRKQRKITLSVTPNQNVPNLVCIGQVDPRGRFTPVNLLNFGGGVTAEDFATQVEAENGTSHTKVMTPLRTKQAIAKLVSIPDSLPANGGNSDTVDNLHGHDFARSLKTIPSSIAQSTTHPTAYIGDVTPETSTAIGLENEWHHLIYSPHTNSNGYGMQIAVKFGTTLLRVRTASGTNYNAWATFSTTSHGHGNKIKGGTNIFGGTGVTKTIAHGMGVKPTAVSITPNSTLTGNIGEWGCTFDATNIYVYNTGTAKTNFSWLAINNF